MNFSQAFNPLRSLKSVFATMKLKPAQLWGGGILLVFLEGGIQGSVRGIEPLGKAFGAEAMAFVVCRL